MLKLLLFHIVLLWKSTDTFLHFILLFMILCFTCSKVSFPKVINVFWYFRDPLVHQSFLNSWLTCCLISLSSNPDRVRHSSGQRDHGHPGPGRRSGGHENQTGAYGGGDQPQWATCHCRGSGAFSWWSVRCLNWIISLLASPPQNFRGIHSD